MKIHKKTQGYLMIFASIALFAVGTIAKSPLEFEKKILVATKSVEGDVFGKSVIFVLQHNIAGARGVILNKSKDGKFTGGPLKPEKVIVLHSDEVTLPQSECMKDTGICYLEGSQAIAALAALPEKPVWQVTVNGYSGWGFRQLEKEIKRGHWKVIDYDGKVVTQTPAGKMWVVANKLPDAKLDDKAD